MLDACRFTFRWLHLAVAAVCHHFLPCISIQAAFFCLPVYNSRLGYLPQNRALSDTSLYGLLLSLLCLEVPSRSINEVVRRAFNEAVVSASSNHGSCRFT